MTHHQGPSPIERLENQIRHLNEQVELQRRLRQEQGEWKHRAVNAELNLIDAQDRLTEVRRIHSGTEAVNLVCLPCGTGWPCATWRACTGG